MNLLEIIDSIKKAVMQESSCVTAFFALERECPTCKFLYFVLLYKGGICNLYKIYKRGIVNNEENEKWQTKEWQKKAAKKAAEAKKAVPVKNVQIKKIEIQPIKEAEVVETVEVKAEEVVVESATEDWCKSGNDRADLKEIAVYVKPEEAAIFYVINGKATGRVSF